MEITNQEEWRSLEDWPYEVSNLGKVRRTTGDIGTYAGRIIKGSNAPYYPIVGLTRRNEYGFIDRKWVARHVLVAAAFLGPRPEGMEIHHKDNNPKNPRLGNLEYITPSQNRLHSVANGHRGSNRWNAVLNDEIVRQIRTAKQAGLSAKSIAEHFDLNISTVYHVTRADNWKHVA